MRFLVAEGRKDLAEELRLRLAAVDSGLISVGSIWLALSSHQRAVLVLLAKFRSVRRVRGCVYEVATTEDRAQPAFPTRLGTIRALGARGLIDWTGGAFDPESSAIISDRGRFVVTHGPANTHWMGSNHA
jgi:hypothetical protein